MSSPLQKFGLWGIKLGKHAKYNEVSSQRPPVEPLGPGGTANEHPIDAAHPSKNVIFKNRLVLSNSVLLKHSFPLTSWAPPAGESL